MNAALKLQAPIDAVRDAIVGRVRARIARVNAALDTMQDLPAATELRLALGDMEAVLSGRMEAEPALTINAEWWMRADGGTLAHVFIRIDGDLGLTSACSTVSRRGARWIQVGDQLMRCKHCARGRR